uniref:Uncharacterized protein n=1 Tax=Opuntia streptacantha TaxID=393608 RepID=A0A7C9DNW8_OPUST
MSKFRKSISCHIGFLKYVFCIKLNALKPPLKNIINDMLNMPRSTYFSFNRLDNYLVIAFNVEIPNAGLYCNLAAISERPCFHNQNRGCTVEIDPILRGLSMWSRRMNPPVADVKERDPSKLSLITPGGGEYHLTRWVEEEGGERSPYGINFSDPMKRSFGISMWIDAMRHRSGRFSREFTGAINTPAKRIVPWEHR